MPPPASPPGKLPPSRPIAALLLGSLLAGPLLAGPAGAARADGPPAPGLTRDEAARAAQRLWEARLDQVRGDPGRVAEVAARRIELDGLAMPFAFRVAGERPAGGRGLFLSLHGGGGAPPRVNDQQYANQQRLYHPEEGVYLAPRAPTDTWDLWHRGHVDRFLARLILDMVAFEGVDPDRVYLMGYSAGGDGVYQVAPRLADRFAAAAMMAGHPNEGRPLGLRNLPFNLQMGGDDAAYDRNKIARSYGAELDALAQADPGGYPHLVAIHPGKGHWMDREDAAAVPWMAGHRRVAAPPRVVWYQDDVTHDQSYWLAIPAGQARAGQLVVAAVDGQEVRVERAEGLAALVVRLDDRLLDLDRPVRITVGGRPRFEGKVPRALATLEKTLAERDDPRLMFAAEVEVAVDPAASPPRP